jgi:hypothetical protein
MDATPKGVVAVEELKPAVGCHNELGVCNAADELTPDPVDDGAEERRLPLDLLRFRGDPLCDRRYFSTDPWWSKLRWIVPSPGHMPMEMVLWMSVLVNL